MHQQPIQSAKREENAEQSSDDHKTVKDRVHVEVVRTDIFLEVHHVGL